MFQKLRNIFRSKPKVRRPFALPNAYTLSMWLATPAMSEEFGKLLKEQLMVSAISVLINQIPSGYPLRGQSVNPTEAAIELGRVEGYLNCLNLLQRLGQTLPVTAHIEETYEQPIGNHDDE